MPITQAGPPDSTPQVPKRAEAHLPGEGRDREALRMRGRSNALLTATEGLARTPASSRGQPCSCVAYARHMLSLSQHPLQACKQPAGGGRVPQSWSAPQLLHRASCSTVLSASTPVRKTAYDPISQMTKLRLREPVSCLRPHSLQGQTGPVTQGL